MEDRINYEVEKALTKEAVRLRPLPERCLRALDYCSEGTRIKLDADLRRELGLEEG